MESERKNPQKKALPDIRKVDKIDHEGTYIIIVGNMVHILKNLIHNMEYMIQQFQMSLKKTL